MTLTAAIDSFIERLDAAVLKSEYRKVTHELAGFIQGHRDQIAALEQASTVQSETPSIKTMPLIKRLREQRDRLADALRQFVRAEDAWRHEKAGVGEDKFDDPLSDAYKAAQEALADVPTYEQQLRNIAEGVGIKYEDLLARFSDVRR